MANNYRPSSRDEFEIAILCALRHEFDAVDALFDKTWEGDESHGKSEGDPNAYITGRIGVHNVVVALLPQIGKWRAAAAAATLSFSFRNIKLGLVVGICGGVPSYLTEDGDERQLVLGDVVISTDIFQTDYGSQYSDEVRPKNALNTKSQRPTNEIKAFLNLLESKRYKRSMEKETYALLDLICRQEEFEDSRYPGKAEDKLYEKNYRHKHQDPACCIICAECQTDTDAVCAQALHLSCAAVGCQARRTVVRPTSAIRVYGSIEESTGPRIHFGRIASLDLVMKSASHRDVIAETRQVIAFEMEGAGVWDTFPTIVIKGVCDYADSHKDKKWQKYAAVAAAACTKAFLKRWRIPDKPTSQSSEVVSQNLTQSNAKHFSVLSELIPRDDAQVGRVNSAGHITSTDEPVLNGHGRSEHVDKLVTDQGRTTESGLLNIKRRTFFGDVDFPLSRRDLNPSSHAALDAGRGFNEVIESPKLDVLAFSTYLLMIMIMITTMMVVLSWLTGYEWGIATLLLSLVASFLVAAESAPELDSFWSGLPNEQKFSFTSKDISRAVLAVWSCEQLLGYFVMIIITGLGLSWLTGYEWERITLLVLLVALFTLVARTSPEDDLWSRVEQKRRAENLLRVGAVPMQATERADHPTDATGPR